MRSKFTKELIKGTFYTGLAKYLSIIISILVTAVLSRILTPDDFGTVAIATVFIGLITLFTGSGLSPAIIQNRNLNKDALSHIFSFTVYLACFGMVLYLLLAPLISFFYQNDTLLYINLALSVNVFFSVVNIVPNALLFKEKRFKYIALRTLVVQFTLGFISILGAKIGLGVYALLINPILGSILLFVVSYRCYPQHFWPRFDFAYSRGLMSYSFFQIGFNLLNFSYRNIDKLLIGKYFGLDKLGYYEKSYRLMMMPLENVSNVINPVLHPLLCEHQEDWHFVFNKYTKVVSYFAYIGFPLTAFLYFSAQDIVLLLFGPQWAPSIPVFSILALSVGIQLIQSAVGAVFQAVGRVKQMFYAGVLSFLATICAIIVGVLSGSLTVLAIYIVIAFYAAFFIYHEMLMHYVFQQSLIHFLPILVRPVIAGFCIALVLWGGKQIIPNISVPVLQLLINASLSVLTFIVLQHLRIIQGIPILINVIKYGLLRFRTS